MPLMNVRGQKGKGGKAAHKEEGGQASVTALVRLGDNLLDDQGREQARQQAPGPPNPYRPQGSDGGKSAGGILQRLAQGQEQADAGGQSGGGAQKQAVVAQINDHGDIERQRAGDQRPHHMAHLVDQ